MVAEDIVAETGFRLLAVVNGEEAIVALEGRPHRLELRPDRKEDSMSSEISTAYLENKDLKMLQEVLVSCGYKGKISANTEREFTVAAKLIIKLFHQGLRE